MEHLNCEELGDTKHGVNEVQLLRSIDVNYTEDQSHVFLFYSQETDLSSSLAFQKHPTRTKLFSFIPPPIQTFCLPLRAVFYSVVLLTSTEPAITKHLNVRYLYKQPL